MDFVLSLVEFSVLESETSGCHAPFIVRIGSECWEGTAVETTPRHFVDLPVRLQLLSIAQLVFSASCIPSSSVFHKDPWSS
jgi:hypothetical protein